MSIAHQTRSFLNLPAVVGAVVAIALAGVIYAKLSGYVPDQPPPSTPVAERELRFVDAADGSVAIFDVATGKQAGTLAPGTNAFMRATLRGLAQERMRRNLGEATPFRLTRWADGRLSLGDPATGRHVELGAFGSTNAQAFARWLTAEEIRQ